MPRGRLSFSSLANFDPSKESNALIVLSITREEVMSCQIGVAADALMKLSDSEEVVKRHEDSLMLNLFPRTGGAVELLVPFCVQRKRNVNYAACAIT